MIKILLINSNLEVHPYPVAPLGIALVASSLNEKFDVKVFDAAFKNSEDFVTVLQQYNPDYVGVGLRNIDNVTMRSCKWYLEDIKNKIIETIKKTKNVPIILGGSGFSIAPQPVLNYLQADYGVIGEAENILSALIHNLNEGILVNMPNVISKEQNNAIIADHSNEILNLPKANIDLFIDIEPYKNRGSYPVQTKRGCTHNAFIVRILISKGKHTD